MAGQSISKGALVLTTDAAQLQSGLSKAQSSIESFSNRVTGLLGAHLGFHALSGFVEQIKSIGDEAENMLNLAEVFDVNVEKMQALSMAANLAGIETESLIKAMRIASTKFPGADPIESLFMALEQLKQIPNVQERIKAAGEIFGGKNAVEVLKIMNADLRGMTDELEKHSVLTKHQLQAWDSIGDSVSKAWTQTKNFGKALVIEVIDNLAIIDQWMTAQATGRKRPFDVVNKVQDAVKIPPEIPDVLAQAAEETERFNRAIQDVNIAKMANAAKEFLDFSTPVDKANLAIAHMQGLLDAGLLTAEEFQIAAGKIADTFKDVNQEFKLPTAAFRGSVEDISARIQSSRSGEQKEMLNIWQRLERNGIKIQGIDGVQN